MHSAAAKGDKHAVESLVTNGANVELPDNAGRTALHYAAGAAVGSANPQGWSADIVRILLDNGANINAKDNLGWTPLHYSASALNKSVVTLLVDRGANLNAVDNRGYTPYSWIRDKTSYYERLSMYAKTRIDEWHKHIEKHYEIARLLRENHGVYFVATTGNDSNIGTQEHPFRTITAAVETAEPGDTIFVRAGTFACPNTIHVDKSGERGKPISLRASGEAEPILDFSSARGDSVLITGAYWHIQGLSITNGSRGGVILYGDGAHHNILEQIKTYENRYTGIRIEAGAAHNIVLNCDSYRNLDLEKNGEDSGGFGAFWDVGKGNIFIGNRAWNNSDDGYQLWDAGHSVRLEECYAWRNGQNIWDHPFFQETAMVSNSAEGLVNMY